MNNIEEIIKEKKTNEEVEKSLRGLGEQVKRIPNDGSEESAKRAAGALKTAITIMFEHDPVKAAQSVVETLHYAQRRSFKLGFIVGAGLAFIAAIIISYIN